MTAVLVGMSLADVDRRDDLLAAARSRGASVAFLQGAEPALSAELTRLADTGVAAVTLVGVDTGILAPGHSWLRRIAAHWWRERTGHRPVILVATSLAGSPHDVDAVLAATRPVTGAEPGLTSEAWEEVPRHRHQVLVCRGPRCSAAGQVEVLRALVLALVSHDLGDDDVLVTHTGCQMPCNQAPVVSVQPDDVWYGGLDPEAVTRVVREHLLEGRPPMSHRLPRSRAASSPPFPPGLG